jgi:hypothetical protein
MIFYARGLCLGVVWCSPLDKGDPGPVILDWEIDRASYHAVPIMSDGTLGPPLALPPCLSNSIRNREGREQAERHDSSACYPSP